MTATLAFQKGVTESGSATSRSLPFTSIASAAGQERLVALCSISADYANTTFSNVAIDGQPATQVGPYVAAPDGNGTHGAFISFWRAPGTANTSVNVTFDIAAGLVFDARGMLWTLNDADTLFDFTAIAGASNVAAGNIDLNLAVDTIAGGAVAAGIMAYGSVTRSAAWSGLTERWDGQDDFELYSGDWYSAADLNVASSSTPLAITVDLPANFTFNSAAAGLAVSFNPMGTGGDVFGTLAATEGPDTAAFTADTAAMVSFLGAAIPRTAGYGPAIPRNALPDTTPPSVPVGLVIEEI